MTTNTILHVMYVGPSEHSAAVRQCLLDAGYELEFIRVDTEAKLMAGLRSGDCDVIVADYSLNAFSALQALEALKTAGPNIPFIVVSQLSGEEAAVELMRLGAHDYLLQANISRLPSAVRSAMDKAGRRDARRREEEDLRDSERGYRDLVEHSHDLMCRHDLNGKVLYINQNAAVRIGFTADAAVGRNIKEILRPEYWGQFDDYIDQLKRYGVAQGVMAVRTREGEELIWSYTNTLSSQGEGPAVVRGIAHDVTEQWKARRALKASQAELRALFAGIDDQVLMLDRWGQCISVAPTNFPHQDKQPANMAGKSIGQIFGENQSAFFLDNIRSALDGKAPHRVEYLLTLGDRELWFEGSISPVSDDAVIWIARDITERKYARDALAQSEERYRLLFESNPLPMWVISVDTFRFLAVNEAAIRHYGYSRDEFMSMRIQDIRPPEDVPSLLKALASVTESAETFGRWRHQKKDGAIIDVEITSHTLRFGGIKAMLAVAKDVTESRRIEEMRLRRARHAALRADIELALAQTHTSLPQVLEACAQALVNHLDADFAALWTISHEVEPVLELQASAGTPRDRPGQLARIPVGVSPIGFIASDRQPHIVNGGQPQPPRSEARGAEKVDEEKLSEPAPIVAFAGHPLLVEDRLIGVIAIYASHPLEDDTLETIASAAGIISQGMERKRVEDALRKSEEQLRQSQKLEAIGQLAGGVAHDFNNLLTVINGYSELLLRRLNNEDPMRASVVEISGAGNRAASLTRQLLAFGRKQFLNPKVLDLNSVVVEIKGILRALLGEEIELRIALDPELGRTKADRGQIEQVIMNLAVNARDAMPHGGRLTIQTENATLSAEPGQDPEVVGPVSYVTLAMTDTGEGMDENTKSRIFEPFFTTKEVGKGTGLGLSTVYGIVRQSGGNIQVSSQLGVGTTFRIYLPYLDDDPPDTEA